MPQQPTMRRMHQALIAFACLVPTLAFAQALDPAAAACAAAAKPPAPIPFDGRVLREAPDLGSEELAGINQMSNVRGCFDDAYARFVAYRAAHPDDYTADFVEARFRWRQGDITGARVLLTKTLTAHPDFASGHVLIGAMAVEEGSVGPASVAFDKASALSPDDLWLAIGRMRVDVYRKPGVDTAAPLIRVLQSPAMPTGAREVAAVAVMELPMLTLDQREAIYRAQLTFESQTPATMKTLNLARFLIEDAKKHEAGRTALAPLFDGSWDELARVLTAESYLLEAAAIDGMPSARNAPLVAKAKAVLDGDLSALARRVSEWPDLRALQPFLVDSVADPDAMDEHGMTALCYATVRLDAAAVAATLARGAKPDAPCNGGTALGSVVISGSKDWDLKRNIIKQLLDRGANPDPTLKGGHYTALSLCDRGADCGTELRPLLLQYVKPAAK